LPTCPEVFRALVVAGLLAGLAACSSPEDEYRKAEQQDTTAAYTEFLARHPQGPLAEQAQSRLESLAEQQAWTTAEAAGTSAAYRGYLEQHPMGPNADAALERLLDLERRSLWVAAEQAGTREALENYLLLYPDSAEAAAARQRLAALAPGGAPPSEPVTPTAAVAPPRPPQLAVRPPASALSQSAPARSAPAQSTPTGSRSYRVQLGAFSSRARAEAQAGTVNARYAGILGGPAQVVDPVPGSPDQFYRLVSRPLPEQDARQACQALRQRGQECLVAAAR